MVGGADHRMVSVPTVPPLSVVNMGGGGHVRGEPAMPSALGALALRKRRVIKGCDSHCPLDGYGLGVMTPDLEAGAHSKRVPALRQARLPSGARHQEGNGRIVS